MKKIFLVGLLLLLSFSIQGNEKQWMQSSSVVCETYYQDDLFQVIENVAWATDYWGNRIVSSRKYCLQVRRSYWQCGQLRYGPPVTVCTQRRCFAGIPRLRLVPGGMLYGSSACYYRICRSGGRWIAL